MIYPFNDARVMERWGKMAKLLPEVSWTLDSKKGCLLVIYAMVRHGVAKYDHRTCVVSLTQLGETRFNA